MEVAPPSPEAPLTPEVAPDSQPLAEQSPDPIAEDTAQVLWAQISAQIADGIAKAAAKPFKAVVTALQTDGKIKIRRPQNSVEDGTAYPAVAPGLIPVVGDWVWCMDTPGGVLVFGEELSGSDLDYAVVGGGRFGSYLATNAYIGDDGNWYRYDTAQPTAVLMPDPAGSAYIYTAGSGANPIAVWNRYVLATQNWVDANYYTRAYINANYWTYQQSDNRYPTFGYVSNNYSQIGHAHNYTPYSHYHNVDLVQSGNSSNYAATGRYYTSTSY